MPKVRYPLAVALGLLALLALTGPVCPADEAPLDPLELQPHEAGPSPRSDPMRRALRWARAHPFGAFALFSLLAFGGANVLAYRHARALTHFDDRGRTWQGKPEGMSIP